MVELGRGDIRMNIALILLSKSIRTVPGNFGETEHGQIMVLCAC